MLEHLYISNYVEDVTDLDMILENEDQVFKSLNQYTLFGVDDFPRAVNIYSYSVDIFLLDNTEITLNVYLVSLKEFIESCLNIGSGAYVDILRYVVIFLDLKSKCYFDEIENFG